MFDFIVPNSIGESNKPCFVKCMNEHAKHVLVDVRRIICAEELDGCLMRITLDCGNSSTKELIVKEFVSVIERTVDKIGK